MFPVLAPDLIRGSSDASVVANEQIEQIARLIGGILPICRRRRENGPLIHPAKDAMRFDRPPPPPVAGEGRLLSARPCRGVDPNQSFLSVIVTKPSSS